MEKQYQDHTTTSIAFQLIALLCRLECKLLATSKITLSNGPEHRFEYTGSDINICLNISRAEFQLLCNELYKISVVLAE